MRLLSLPIGDDLLEVHNNMWTGEERIFLNGELASRGHSFFGKNHYFTADNPDGDGVDKYRVEIGIGFGGITVDVFRNDRCLLGSRKTPLTRVDAAFQTSCDSKPFHLRRMEREDTLDEKFFV